ACVEVAVGFAATRGVVRVRDSKQVSGSVLRVSADAFFSFVAGVRGGELDAV
ncbi:DUF397 domain-containing protein, partial [Streptomyces halstedii]|uniref:DUF397 domain-containing protein n=2 Tax=Streptomyces TaxID=1883 RepID=UPI0036CBE4B9